MAESSSSKGSRRRLGRGLSSMVRAPASIDISTQPDAATGDETGVTAGGVSETVGTEHQIRRIPVSSIRPNRFQPRRTFSEASLRELADSMRSAGVIQPIVVRPVTTGDGTEGYELIAGERRWRAAEYAGLSDLPAIVREVSDEQSAEWALIENIQREDLNPMERAFALRQLGERFGLTQAQIGEKVGLDRSSVANLIRLTELEGDIQDMVRTGALGMGHARALLAVPAGADRVELAHTAVSEEWTVRRLEEEARRIRRGGGGGGSERLAHHEQVSGGVPTLSDLERQLSEYLGTRVTITTNRAGNRGRITIAFYDLDHFDGLMSRLGFRMQG